MGYRISSGPLEGTNNKIKTMKRMAYGFRDVEFFKLIIMGLHETRYVLTGLNQKYHLYGLRSIGNGYCGGDIRERAKSIFEEIAISHDFEIDTLEVSDDHVHIFLSFPARTAFPGLSEY
jgi:hypothetical protein